MSPRQNGGTNPTTNACGPLSPTDPQVSNQAATNNDQIPLQVCFEKHRLYLINVIRLDWSSYLCSERYLKGSIFSLQICINNYSNKHHKTTTPCVSPPISSNCNAMSNTSPPSTLLESLKITSIPDTNNKNVNIHEHKHPHGHSVPTASLMASAPATVSSGATSNLKWSCHGKFL